MNLMKILPTFFILVVLSREIHGVLFYEHRDYQGRYYRAPAGWGGKCNNMEDWANDLTSSINNEGHCVKVYEHGDCEGQERLIFTGSCCHENLVDIQMNDEISSYRGC